MKKIISLVCLLGALLAIPASAQLSGTYSTVLNGGTNNVLAATTNTYSANVTNAAGFVWTVPTIVMPCAEHPSVGLDVLYSCGSNSATNANLIVLGYQSYDNGNTFETSPSIILTNAFPTAIQQGASLGFTNRVALFSVATPNATHVGFQIGNTHATLNVTNVTVSFSLNNTRNFSEAARR